MRCFTCSSVVAIYGVSAKNFRQEKSLPLFLSTAWSLISSGWPSCHLGMDISNLFAQLRLTIHYVAKRPAATTIRLLAPPNPWLINPNTASNPSPCSPRSFQLCVPFWSSSFWPMLLMVPKAPTHRCAQLEVNWILVHSWVNRLEKRI